MAIKSCRTTLMANGWIIQHQIHRGHQPRHHRDAGHRAAFDPAEMDAAIEAAQRAFPEWRQTPPVTRARYMFRLKEAMEARFEEYRSG